MRRSVLGALFACTFACVGDQGDRPGERPGTLSEPITNGTADSSDPAVVGLVDSTGALLCSGTLISPHVVLTAAHCLEGATHYVDDRVFFGASLAATSGTFIAVSGVLQHPQFDPTTLSNDLALLALASPATATPIPLLAATPDASLVNAQVRIVGFGESSADAGDFGQKRSGTANVESVTATTLSLAAAPSQQCAGDSGGPALLTVGGVEYLAGVTSNGDTFCDMSDVDTRADAYLASFIAPFVAVAADGAAGAGQPCFYPGNCSSGSCVSATDDPNILYCAPPCTKTADCPATMVCTSAGDGSGSQCRYPLPTPGALGSPCAASSDCFDTECNAKQVCSQRCVQIGDDCPSGFECDNIGGIDFYCMAQPPAAAPPHSSCSSCASALQARESRGGWLSFAIAAALIAARRTTRGGRARTRETP